MTMAKLLEKLGFLVADEGEQWRPTTGLERRLKDAQAVLADLLGPGTPVYLCTWGEHRTADSVRNGAMSLIDGRVDGPGRGQFGVRMADGSTEAEVMVKLPGQPETSVWLTEEAARQLGAALLAAARTPGAPHAVRAER